MRKLVSYIPLILVLSGCIHTYKNITVFEDRSAKMIFDRYSSRTDSTSGITYPSYVIDTIIVKDVDSLALYLTRPSSNYYDFSYDSNTFKLKVADSLPFDSTTFRRHVPNTLKWEFPHKISSISGQGIVHLNRNRNKLVIKSKNSNYLKSGEKVNISVLFEPGSNGSKIRHPFGFKRIGYAIDPLPGIGLANVNGTASRYLDGSYFMNWGFSTFILNRIRLVPRLAILQGKTNGNLNNLEAYTHFENTSLEFGIGYELLNNSYINITPIMYGGVNKLIVYVEDDSAPTISKNGDFKYSVGATIDLKIDPLFRSKERRKSKKNEYFYIKVDGGLYPKYFKKSLSLKGSVHYLTFAIGGYLSGDNNFRRVILDSN